MLSRRWFYFVPAQGEPRKLVHRIEPRALDHLPGKATKYLRWQELEKGVGQLLAGAKRVAMEYVPRNANPYVSRVDAGTVELVRSFGVEIVPSGDLVQLFEACWDDEQWAMHLEAAKHTRSAYDVAFAFIADRVSDERLGARDGSAAVHPGSFRRHTIWSPIIRRSSASARTAAIRTTLPVPAPDGTIREGRFRADRPVGQAGQAACRLQRSDVDVLRRRRRCRTNIEDLPDRRRRPRCRHRQGAARLSPTARRLQGWQVDQAARDVIDKAGYGEDFCHRTGHSIGQETHGNGANMDNLETHEERRVLPRTCFSVEPGIYLPEFGVRSEVNVFVDKGEQVHVTGGTPQTEIEPLFEKFKLGPVHKQLS